MALAERDKPLNRFGFNWFNFIADTQYGALTNGMIAPLTTVAGSGTTSLEGLIRSRTVPEVYKPLREQAADAMVCMKTIGTLTDTNVGTADTVVNLRNIFIGLDSNLGGTAWDTMSICPR